MGRKYNFRSGKITTKLLKLTPTTAPVAPAAKQGDMYVRSADGKLRIYTGSAWETVSSS
jgi:hypothetical protein